jgi:hypothetical protein
MLLQALRQLVQVQYSPSPYASSFSLGAEATQSLIGSNMQWIWSELCERTLIQEENSEELSVLEKGGFGEY